MNLLKLKVIKINFDKINVNHQLKIDFHSLFLKFFVSEKRIYFRIYERNEIISVYLRK